MIKIKFINHVKIITLNLLSHGNSELSRLKEDRLSKARFLTGEQMRVNSKSLLSSADSNWKRGWQYKHTIEKAHNSSKNW